VKAANGLEGKVIAFEAHFERAGVKNYASRTAYALEALNAYQSTQDAPQPLVPTPPIPVISVGQPAPQPISPPPLTPFERFVLWVKSWL